MTASVRAHSEPPARASFTPAPVGLARRCACGGVPGPSGECESCRRKRQGTPARSAQRRSASPGLRRAADPGGALEREADSVAAAVVDGRAALPVRRRPVPRDVQRQEARPGPAPATSFPAQQTLSPEHDLEQWKRVLDEVLKATPGEALRRLETTRVGKKLEKFLDTPTGKAVAGAVVTGAVASAITINALLQESAGEPKGRVPSGEFVPKVPPLALDFPEARAPGKPPPPPTKAVTPGPLAPTAAGEANDAFMSWYVQQSLRERDDLMERTRDAAGELGGAVDRMTAFRIWLDLLGRPEGEKRSSRNRACGDAVLPVPVQAGVAVDRRRRSRGGRGRPPLARSIPRRRPPQPNGVALRPRLRQRPCAHRRTCGRVRGSCRRARLRGRRRHRLRTRPICARDA